MMMKKVILLQEVNQFLAEDGLILYDDGAHWLISAPKPIELLTRSLTLAQGQPIQTDEIAGVDAKYWRSLQAELGMLLHQSSVNQARRQQGLVTVDSLWLWGSGQLSTSDYQSSELTLCSEAKVAQGLAMFCNAPYFADMSKLDQTDLYYSELCQQAVLSADYKLWQEALRQLEKMVFVPLLQRLKQGQLKSVSLYLGRNKAFSVTSWGDKEVLVPPSINSELLSCRLESKRASTVRKRLSKHVVVV
ncbi:hypothetical protein [Piscirickettsia litoralis]|uniref:hypothetical protein n=1 Tax=Piscirickettsia litoralis TaxID=1891921 RepID=UPI001F47ED56|nr:hypothetical protein [Piscirickettsia litoralis]